MNNFKIDNIELLNNLVSYIKETNIKTPKVSFKNNCCYIECFTETFEIDMFSFTKEQRDVIFTWSKNLNSVDENTALIFGKDSTENIVSCEINDKSIELFIETNGTVSSKFIPNVFWILSCKKFDSSWQPLKGNLHYKFIKYYDNKGEFYNDKKKYKEDVFVIHDSKEAAMVLNGFTYFKNTKVEDVSRMHFDLETTGLVHNDKSRVLLISTTWIKRGVEVKRLFACDEFESDGAMIEAFCSYVRECNPSVLSGFNIFGFDFPYLNYCANKLGVVLNLGRDNSKLRFEKYTSKFRKDGSQDYEYTRCYVYGREIIDLMFTAYHFDFSRKYERYGLKSIIKQEGLEKPGRTFYDAGLIFEKWDNLEERKKIKAYCIDDSDDCESLYKLMIAQYFYFNRSIPKSFQSLNYTATGSQLNSFLIRSYLQQGHSIPRADISEPFEGAISFAVPGIYNNLFKQDLNALYPSIIRSFEIFSKEKDPNANLLKMTNYFTDERLKNKKLAKDTDDRYYKEMEQSQKIAINSLYGLMGAPGLHFNYPKGAARVTEIGREILKFTIFWATGKKYEYWIHLFNEKTGNNKNEEDM